jgi:hypothetical protein
MVLSKSIPIRKLDLMAKGQSFFDRDSGNGRTIGSGPI